MQWPWQPARMIIRRVYGAQQIPKMPTMIASDLATFLSLESLKRWVMLWDTIFIRFSKDRVDAEFLQLFLLQHLGFLTHSELVDSRSFAAGLAVEAAAWVLPRVSAESFCLQHFKASFASGLISISSVKDWLCASWKISRRILVRFCMFR